MCSVYCMKKTARAEKVKMFTFYFYRRMRDWEGGMKKKASQDFMALRTVKNFLPRAQY